jgi:hypothetical protein
MAKRMIIALTAMLGTAAMAAQSTLPLPSNYKTIFENPDLLVMRVHYGPQEFVPMHDHSAFTTVYVYLNDSGVVRIDHESGSEPSVNRPPTHTGAFRISPGVAERHSVKNLDDKPSDFLRVELKRIPADDIKDAIRGPVPADLEPGTNTEFRDPALQIERVLCPPDAGCIAAEKPDRSLLVAITPVDATVAGGAVRSLQVGDVLWLASNEAVTLSKDAQVLRISLLFARR